MLNYFPADPEGQKNYPISDYLSCYFLQYCLFGPGSEKLQKDVNESIIQYFQKKNITSDVCNKNDYAQLIMRFFHLKTASNRNNKGEVSDPENVKQCLDFFTRHGALTPEQFNALHGIGANALLDNEEQLVQILNSLSPEEAFFVINRRYDREQKILSLPEHVTTETVQELKDREAFETASAPLFSPKGKLSLEQKDRLYQVMSQYCDHHDFHSNNERYSAARALGVFLSIYCVYFYGQRESFSAPNEEFEQKLQFVQNHLNLVPFQLTLIKREPLQELLQDQELVDNYGRLTMDDYILVTEYSKNPRELFREKRDDRNNESKYLVENVHLGCSAH